MIVLHTNSREYTHTDCPIHSIKALRMRDVCVKFGTEAELLNGKV